MKGRPQRAAERPTPPALALLLALSLHAAVWVGAHGMARPLPSRSLQGRDADTAIELMLGQGERASPATSEATPPPITLSPPAPSRTQAARSEPAVRLGTAAPPEPGAAEPRAEAGAPGALPHAIDLGLNDGVRRAALLGGWLELPAAPARRPSDGGLRQGLAARDAERGLGRSSAANHAAYQAARRFAPATGSGVFDVTTDERGVVLSVTLASAPANEVDWQRVGEELHQLLKDRRLRVPSGARGLVARLRIETGELALDNAGRFRTERRPALGQAPAHPRELRTESTRSSLEPGQLSPTLGVSLSGSGSGRIRVVLVDERAL